VDATSISKRENWRRSVRANSAAPSIWRCGAGRIDGGARSSQKRRSMIRATTAKRCRAMELAVWEGKAPQADKRFSMLSAALQKKIAIITKKSEKKRKAPPKRQDAQKRKARRRRREKEFGKKKRDKRACGTEQHQAAQHSGVRVRSPENRSEVARALGGRRAYSNPKPTSSKPKYYVLEMLPYPSGTCPHGPHAPLHDWRCRGARSSACAEFNVMIRWAGTPSAWPAENAAIKNNTHRENGLTRT